MPLRLADFIGDWRLKREVTEASGAQARFLGVARFVPEGAGLRCLERGELVLEGGARMHAERACLWREEGGRIHVSFADGRAFHDFVPDGQADARHWCDPDDYRVAYDFSGWPVWRAIWRVRGPRKDYTMVSDFSRE